MRPLLLVTGARAGETVGGRQQLAWLHRDALTTLCGDRLVVHVLVPAAASRSAALQGYLDGLSPEVIDAIVTQARTRTVGQVFLDGSNLGLLARAVKRALPKVEVLTFCHNVEARFFFGSFKVRPSLHSAGVFLANYHAERMAVLWSDRIITLSERDSTVLRRFYGRGATDLLPMAMADQTGPTGNAKSEAVASPYALLVGGNFYANLRGAQWYVHRVAPHVSLPTVIVGRGMEVLRPELEKIAGVRVVGGVADLAPWYRDAAVAVAPIFDGSGMKTKVAEALMYGKPVVGTPEAFSGYADDVISANWCASDAAGFAIGVADAAARASAWNPTMRELYLRHHSNDALLKRLASIVGQAGQTSDS